MSPRVQAIVCVVFGLTAMFVMALYVFSCTRNLQAHG